MSENQTDESSGKLVVGAFLTLDGVMQAPGGPDEDRDGGTNLAFRMDSDSASNRKTLEEFDGVEAANQTLDRLTGFLANDGAGGAK